MKTRATRATETVRTATSTAATPAVTPAAIKPSILSGFTLCPGDRPLQYYVTFTGGYLRFSNTCMDALNEADYIHIYLDRVGKRLAITKAEADAKFKFSFLHKWRERAEKAKASNGALRMPQKEAKIGIGVNKLREIFDIKGTRQFEGEFIPEENALVFKLGA